MNVLKQNSDFETVIIISPSHTEYFKGSTIFDGDAYRTPLGDVPINRELAEVIVENGEFVSFGNLGHKQEHALEVHLPFLQMIKDEFDIVKLPFATLFFSSNYNPKKKLIKFGLIKKL